MEEIDYEALRQRNIANNNNFLKTLDVEAFGEIFSKAIEPADVESVSVEDTFVLEEDAEEFCQRCKDALSSCEEIYPFRSIEAQRIVSYIEQAEIALPAMLLHGGTGSGKSAVCRHILQHTRVLHATVLCTCYSDSLQVLQAMWDGMQSAAEARFEAAGRGSSWNDIKGGHKNRKISFATLYDSIRGFMGGLALSRFVVVLDHVDYLERLDADTAEKLLCLSELVHPGIKVIGIRRNVLGVNCSDKITLAFKQYSDSEIVKIISGKVNKIAEEVGHRSPPSKQWRGTPPSSRGKKRPLRPAEGSAQGAVYPSNQEEVQRFREVLQDVLPRVRMTTGHVDDIMSAALQVWSQSAPGDAAAHAAVTQQVLRLPFFRCQLQSNSAGGKLSQHFEQMNESLVDLESLRGLGWVGDLPYKARYLLIAAFLASKISRESDKFTFGEEKKGRRKRSRAGHDAATEAPTNTGADASLLYAQQSFNLERLLAIFKHIYDTNHRMYDAEGQVDSTPSLVPLPRGSSSSSNAQTLVLSGDDHFVAMINTLERRNFITAAPSWRDDQPVYYCALDRETIKIIARSVHFPLENYVSSTAN